MTILPFLQRKLPVPGFKVEIVMIDYDGTIPEKYKSSDKPMLISSNDSSPSYNNPSNSNSARNKDSDENVFSDSDDDDDDQKDDDKSTVSIALPPGKIESEVTTLNKKTQLLSLNSNPTLVKNEADKPKPIPNLNPGDIKAIAADASVFSFGDDEDDLSD